MKRIVITSGLIAGAIVSAWLIIGIAWCYNSGNFEGNIVLGYASMLLAFSLIFVGVKNYRDKYNQGVISFGKAFQVGLYIALIASTMYMLVWLIDYYVFIPDFMDKYCAHVLNDIKNSGASSAEIATQTQDILEMKEMYKNPVMVVLFTYMEILPVGLVVALVSAFILKRKVSS